MTVRQGATPLITVALSTMGKKPEEFEKILFDLSKQEECFFDVLVLCQSSMSGASDDLIHILSEKDWPFGIEFIESKKNGLLKSRNDAIRSAKGEYLLFADDDCRYFSDSLRKIESAISNNPLSDILTFQSVNEKGELLNPKNDWANGIAHNWKSVMSVSSIEIVVRRDYLLGDGAFFDERFGLGTPFSTGGENIMLIDNLRKNAVITFYREVIVCHPKESSGSGKNGLETLAFAKGAMFSRMFGWKGCGILLAFLFAKKMSREGPSFELRHFKAGLKGFLKSPGPEK